MHLAIVSECEYVLLSAPALPHAIDTGTSLQLEGRVDDAITRSMRLRCSPTC